MMCVNSAKQILANPSAHTNAEILAAMKLLANRLVINQ